MISIHIIEQLVFLLLCTLFAANGCPPSRVKSEKEWEHLKVDESIKVWYDSRRQKNIINRFRKQHKERESPKKINPINMKQIQTKVC